MSTSILRGEDGQPSGAILAFNDLSQIKVLEEEKRRIERLASIGAFMSGIAHEIKNPLVAIKTLAELLPEQYDDEEFRDTFTKVTLNEVDRIDTLSVGCGACRAALQCRCPLTSFPLWKRRFPWFPVS